MLFVTVLVATVFCAAVNCYTYRLAYPLWRKTGAAEFRELHQEYLRRLFPVITLPHVVMFFSSAALVVWRPLFVGWLAASVVFVLDGGVVAVSVLLAGPVHAKLEESGSLSARRLRSLIAISAWRSGMMVAACIVLGVVLIRALR